MTLLTKESHILNDLKEEICDSPSIGRARASRLGSLFREITRVFQVY